MNKEMDLKKEMKKEFTKYYVVCNEEYVDMRVNSLVEIAKQAIEDACKRQRDTYIERVRKIEVKPIDKLLIEMAVCEIEKPLATATEKK